MLPDREPSHKWLGYFQRLNWAKVPQLEFWGEVANILDLSDGRHHLLDGSIPGGAGGVPAQRLSVREGHVESKRGGHFVILVFCCCL